MVSFENRKGQILFNPLTKFVSKTFTVDYQNKISSIYWQHLPAKIHYQNKFRQQKTSVEPSIDKFWQQKRIYFPINAIYYQTLNTKKSERKGHNSHISLINAYNSKDFFCYSLLPYWSSSPSSHLCDFIFQALSSEFQFLYYSGPEYPLGQGVVFI